MARKSLVLILGAGASYEAGLPLGINLRDTIAQKADIRYLYLGGFPKGDSTIEEALKLLDPLSAGDVTVRNHLLRAMEAIRVGVPQAQSIDNFIDSRRDDPWIAVCGKLTIARCILQAECTGLLVGNHTPHQPQFVLHNLRNTWYGHFFHRLVEHCQRDELPARLRKLAVVDFNYDRTFEQYLHVALQTYFDMSSDEASAALAHLEVYHPYGTVGSLPWQGRDFPIQYGDTGSAERLVEVSKLIRTFTEGTDPRTSSIGQIRSTVREADRLAFLGFAYHKLNMHLLFTEGVASIGPATQSVFGTAYGLSDSDTRAITDDIQTAVGSLRFIELRNTLKCVDLLGEYQRALSLI